MIPWLASGEPFPPTTNASTDPDGLVAIGGDLSTSTLLRAYRKGIFPWFEENQPIMWWSPNPRCVLYPDELKISRSLKKTLKSGKFSVTTNRVFEEVIRKCGPRRHTTSATWITEDMCNAYIKLHRIGVANSTEVWLNDELVGGLYGLSLGKIFFGESMFSVVRDASKVALVNLSDRLKEDNIKIIDCQVYSDHLASLGAKQIERRKFEEQLNLCILDNDVQSIVQHGPC